MTLLTSLWTWYISLFSDQDNKVKIAAVTVTIPAISFVITFLLKPLSSYLKGKLSKVKVKTGISHQLQVGPFDTEVEVGTPLLTCTVTNHNPKTIFIHNPLIKLLRKINGDNSFVVPKEKGTFPMKLEPEQQVTLEYKTSVLNNQLLHHVKEQDKVGFIITTSSGKKCYSNRFTKKYITEHMQAADDLNKE